MPKTDDILSQILGKMKPTNMTRSFLNILQRDQNSVFFLILKGLVRQMNIFYEGQENEISMYMRKWFLN